MTFVWVVCLLASAAQRDKGIWLGLGFKPSVEFVPLLASAAERTMGERTVDQNLDRVWQRQCIGVHFGEETQDLVPVVAFSTRMGRDATNSPTRSCTAGRGAWSRGRVVVLSLGSGGCAASKNRRSTRVFFLPTFSKIWNQRRRSRKSKMMCVSGSARITIDDHDRRGRRAQCSEGGKYVGGSERERGRETEI